ncbi:hypothetical protein PtA15_10A244 [Puccinia triticina]|uniref:Chitin-binding type-2 domain-containing protein n=1 Tax=Puccinia triticina TaxID=208348 RepID=A0ABY7CW05_9BASI|nr:uncharacterized protein PtA15_10A244 [Puccinia triticina]WAQ88824.1 hypothetical protein PtA15_10A244 [Puccinia triticina]WAR58885.1 hypothetical protein PtB15_10B224 [Puccinia triticina]
MSRLIFGHRLQALTILLISSGLLVDAAKPSPQITTKCDTYFHPTRDARLYMCVNAKDKYKCDLESCGENSKPWSDFTFANCLHYVGNDYRKNPIPGTTKAVVHPLQYHVNAASYVDAQDRDDRHWYRCTFKDPADFNARRAACTDCRIARSKVGGGD